MVPLIDSSESLAEELFLHKLITVDAGQQPIRLDHYLKRFFPEVSRTRIQYAANQGYISVNEVSRKPSYKVKGGEQISVVLPHPPRTAEIVPQEIPLNIIFEDEHILVIDKPAGMVVHPGVGNPDGTLVNAILWHLGYKEPLAEPVEGKADFPRPGLVHRIDKNTSGLLVIAKSDLALTHLAGQFYYKTAYREYLALVWGRVTPDKGTIKKPIGRHSSDRTIFETKEDLFEGKPAITHYEVVRHLNYLTLLRCRLETGRTHQIRVHLKSIGHTVFNDPEYGGQRVLKGPNDAPWRNLITECMSLMHGQALHAYALRFLHPVTNDLMSFETPVPNVFQRIIEKIEEWNSKTLQKSSCAEN